MTSREIDFMQVNAFTRNSSGGNPAGVVIDANGLSAEQMQNLAKHIGCSETAFVLPSEKADYRVRFFSPSVEVDLCGHATIATFYGLGEKDVLSFSQGVASATQETNAGVLTVDVFKNNDDQVEKVMMEQGRPEFKQPEVTREEVARALNIDVPCLDKDAPLELVSTGLFSLYVGVTGLDVLGGLTPDFSRIKTLCQRIGAGSMYVFTFETKETSSSVHGRDFAPLYGINEDPVTGTASGALGCYLVKNHLSADRKFVCEQGDFVDRPGKVYVEIEKNKDTITDVRVGGSAVITEEDTMVV